jgi:hypothetical protein
MTDSNSNGQDPGSAGPEEFAQQFIKAWQTARSQFQELQTRLKQGAAAGRHQFEAGMLRHERSKLLERLGFRLYERVLKGEFKDLPENMLNICARLEEVDRYIEEQEAQAKERWGEAVAATAPRADKTDDPPAEAKDPQPQPQPTRRRKKTPRGPSSD